MKIKKKKALSWLLIFVFMGTLTACSSKARPAKPDSSAEATEETQESDEDKTNEDKTEESKTEEAQAGEETPALPEAGFEELEALVGMDDERAAEHFPGSLENWTEDKGTFIGRIYQVSLLETPITVYTSYNAENKVASVSAWITDGTAEVTEDEGNEWVQHVTEYAGSDPVYDGTSSEAGSQNWKWKKDGNFITLHWLGDIITLEMQPAVGELH